MKRYKNGHCVLLSITLPSQFALFIGYDCNRYGNIYKKEHLLLPSICFVYTSDFHRYIDTWTCTKKSTIFNICNHLGSNGFFFPADTVSIVPVQSIPSVAVWRSWQLLRIILVWWTVSPIQSQYTSYTSYIMIFDGGFQSLN